MYTGDMIMFYRAEMNAHLYDDSLLTIDVLLGSVQFYSYVHEQITEN